MKQKTHATKNTVSVSVLVGKLYAATVGFKLSIVSLSILFMNDSTNLNIDMNYEHILVARLVTS